MGAAGALGRFRVHIAVVAAWVAMVILVPTRVTPDHDAAPFASGAVGGPDRAAVSDLPGGAGPPTTPSVGASPSPSPEMAAETTEAHPWGPAAPSPPSTEDANAARNRHGVACIAGALQFDGPYAPPCQPAFSGDNGGATHRGVTADTIRLGYRMLTSAGETNEYVASIQPYVDWGNELFELYGRRVELVPFPSRFGNAVQEAQSRGRTGACQDAAVLTDELEVFGVAWDASLPFAQCAAERDLPVLNSETAAPETLLAAQHPYVWSAAHGVPCERAALHVIEYVGRRLAGRPAVYAADPDLRGLERRFGIYVPDNEEYQPCIDGALDVARDRYGVEFVRFDYQIDAPRIADQAVLGVRRFRAEGVTSLVLSTEVNSAGALTRAANLADWGPEWIATGFGATDYPDSLASYNQSQVDGHLFGPTYVPDVELWTRDSSVAAAIYRARTGTTPEPVVALAFWEMVQVFRMLQAAGPTLTPHTLAAGALTLPPADGVIGRMHFAESVTGGPGVSHGARTSDLEMFYGGGLRHIANGGAWFELGQWPSTPPPVFGG